MVFGLMLRRTQFMDGLSLILLGVIAALVFVLVTQRRARDALAQELQAARELATTNTKLLEEAQARQRVQPDKPPPIESERGEATQENELRDKLERAQQKTRALETELEQSQAHTKRLQDELEASQARAIDLDKRIESARVESVAKSKEVETNRDLVETQKRELEASYARTKTLQSEIEDVRRDTQQYVTQLEQARGQAKQFEDDTRRFRTKSEELAKELADLRTRDEARIRGLANALRQIEEDLATAQMQKDAFAAEARALRDELERRRKAADVDAKPVPRAKPSKPPEPIIAYYCLVCGESGSGPKPHRCLVEEAEAQKRAAGKR